MHTPTRLREPRNLAARISDPLRVVLAAIALVVVPAGGQASPGRMDPLFGSYSGFPGMPPPKDICLKPWSGFATSLITGSIAGFCPDSYPDVSSHSLARREIVWVKPRLPGRESP